MRKMTGQISSIKISQVEDEVIQKIMDELDDCADYCVDYAYEVELVGAIIFLTSLEWVNYALVR